MGNVPQTLVMTNIPSQPRAPMMTALTATTEPQQQQSSSSSRRRQRVIVVGAGLSGCVAAWCVRRALTGGDSAASSSSSITTDVDIEVWDGARGCGGRLATQRVATQGGEETRMNMGAQRLHYYSDIDEACCAVRNELIACLEEDGIVEVIQPQAASSSAGVAHQKRGGGVGILLPKGASNEICRWMLTNAKVQTQFQSRIRSIDFDSSKNQFVVSLFGGTSSGSGGGGRRGRNNKKSSNTTRGRGGRNNSSSGRNNNDSGKAELFDAVVFAGSPAEVRTTYGDMQQLTKPLWRQVGRTQHTRNCCLGLVFRGDGLVVRSILAAFQNHPVVPADDDQGIIEEMILQPNRMAHHIGSGGGGGGSAPPAAAAAVAEQQRQSQKSNKKQKQSNDDNHEAVILVAVSTEKFAETHCQHVRATHRPTAQDREHQRLLTETLLKRVCQLLAAKTLPSAASYPLSSTGPSSRGSADQFRKAVVARKLNYWKYAQVQMTMMKQNQKQQQQCRSSSNKMRPKSCFIADCEAPFVVVGDYFPSSHQAQQGNEGNSSRNNHKACGFTAVVQSGEAAANEVARVLLQ